MIFEAMRVSDAIGAILAHSQRLKDDDGSLRTLKKGRKVTAEDAAALEAAGIDKVVAARPGPHDVLEDEAARIIAEHLVGPGTEIGQPFTGRCNIFASSDGLLTVDAERVNKLNAIDEAVTVATLEPFEAVTAQQMVATVKIMPFAVPRILLGRCIAALEGKRGVPAALGVSTYGGYAAELIQTVLPGLKPSLLDKTLEANRERVELTGGRLTGERRVEHDVDSLVEALHAETKADLILIAGASAVVDRRDVIPAAIEAAGGSVVHFGMPVDPGNLLLVGRLGRRTVLGLPGCARSPKLNGFDWVLRRFAAGLPFGRAEITRMGVGGLLKEIPTRPQPRRGENRAGAGTKIRPQVAAIILAAGQSRRMGPVNKLLAEVDGRPMVAHAVAAAKASAIGPVVVVTGHEGDKVARAIGDQDVTVVANPRFAEGLSTSLAVGLSALPESVSAALVVLGDMPGITAGLINKLIAAYDPTEGRAICVPTHRGKRGNPVLWDRRFFGDMASISGDVGARHLIGSHGELVAEVEMADAAVLMDIDTPEALARLSAKREVG